MTDNSHETFMAELARDLQRFGESVNTGREAEESRAIVIDRILAGLRASTVGMRSLPGASSGTQANPWSTFSSAFSNNLQQAGWASLEGTGSGLLKAQPTENQADALAIAGLRAGLDAGAATLRAHDPFGLAHLELSYGIENTDSPSWSALFVKPLYESAGKDRVAFAQMSLTRENADTTYNGGFTARFLTPNRQWLVGPNTFLDYTTRHSHSRMSVGLDAKTNNFSAATNRYFRLKDWKDSRFGYEERALSGYDVEVAGRLPHLPTFELFARQFFWWQDGASNINGQEYALEHFPIPLLRTRVAYVDTDGGSHEASIKTQITYRFGVPLKDQLRVPEPSATDLLDRRFEKVRRENTIRTQERLKAEVRGVVIETVGANTLSDADGSRALLVNARVTPPATLTIADTVGAIARIRFGDGALLTLGRNTTVNLDLGRLTLVSGILQYTSGSGHPHVITVPGGTINLLGTDVDVRVADGTSTVRVRDGAIRVQGTGNSMTASSLEMVNLAGGAPVAVAEAAPLFQTHADDASEKLDLVAQTQTERKVAPYVGQTPVRLSGGGTVGQTIRFAVTYSKPVTVSGGTPSLNLTINGTDRTAPLVEGAGTHTLVFEYSLVSGDIGATIGTLTNINRNGAEIASEGQAAVTTFKDTSVALAGGAAIIPDDTTPPAGYGVAWTTSPVNAANQTAAAFAFSGAEVGASYAYSITSSSGAGTVSGTGVIASASQALTGLNLSSLPDGTLTVSATLSDTAGNVGVAATDTVIKNTDWCTDPAALALASPGTACPDGSIYAGNLSGTYLITHVSGCWFEPSGTSSTKASASFTPTCGGAVDIMVKLWSNSTGVNEGATSLTNGLTNTNQLLADAQRLNPAAAYCYHMDLNGKTDWYLPARNELNVLYTNRISIGGFASANYWPSSEFGSNFAWAQDFSNGLQYLTSKLNSLRVRCVRKVN